MPTPSSPLKEPLRFFGQLPGTRLLKICGLGVAAGLVVVAFHAVVVWLEGHTMHAWTALPRWEFAGLSFLCVVGGSLLATALIRWIAPDAAGGGVLPVKLAFWRDFGLIGTRTAIAKFLGSALTLGLGVSMGPEGPAIQIGASAMSGASARIGVVKQERREYCAGGAAAGLAAVFNAPLGAIAFVLEEIIGDLHSRFLGTVVLGAVMGALVAHALIGPQPAFQVTLQGQPEWIGYVLCPLVAALAAAAGGLFQRGALRFRGTFRRWRRLPRWSVPALGALGTWICGCLVFFDTGRLGIFGVGYQDVTAALAGTLSVRASALLFAGKLAATMLAVGTANCGGIFAPNFFIGATCGSTVASLLGYVLPLNPADEQMLVMVGMCACLGAVIRTPLACMLLIFEVTNQFAIVPALLIATLVSQGVGRLMARHDMYEEQLLQDGIEPHLVLPPRHYKRWREMPASALASFKPVTVVTLEPAALRALLAHSPHARFPVVVDGRVTGMLGRREAEQALEQQRAPHLEPALWVDPKASVADAQKQLIASTADMVCVGDEPSQQLLGVLTLHDLLRGQQALAEDAPASP
ncbi:MAG TPA: chloride channel protein [Opitutaceae bacterium]|nr:chloride channel protein [Opitutaceae bacterium]